MSKSSLFILSFNFHYVSLMLKFSDPAKRERGGKKKEKHAEKKGGEKRAERQRGEKSVPKREETCRKEMKRHAEKRRGHRQVR